MPAVHVNGARLAVDESGSGPPLVLRPRPRRPTRASSGSARSTALAATSASSTYDLRGSGAQRGDARAVHHRRAGRRPRGADRGARPGAAAPRWATPWAARSRSLYAAAHPGGVRGGGRARRAGDAARRPTATGLRGPGGDGRGARAWRRSPRRSRRNGARAVLPRGATPDEFRVLRRHAASERPAGYAAQCRALVGARPHRRPAAHRGAGAAADRRPRRRRAARGDAGERRGDPRRRLRVVEDCGHILPCERPEVVESVALPFLREHG